jgi:hypothetical protein
MRPPLFLSEMGDILMFKSLEDIERYIELPEVKNSRVFDAEGTEFGLQISAVDTADQAIRWYAKLVQPVHVPVIRVVADIPLMTPRVEFEGILREYLSDSDLDTNLLRSMSLTDLVSYLESANRFTR